MQKINIVMQILGTPPTCQAVHYTEERSRPTGYEAETPGLNIRFFRFHGQHNLQSALHALSKVIKDRNWDWIEVEGDKIVFDFEAFINELESNKATTPKIHRLDWMKGKAIVEPSVYHEPDKRNPLKIDTVLEFTVTEANVTINRFQHITFQCSPSDILSSLVLLECETEMKQGTAFLLKDVGLVTCAHVLGMTTKAFHPTTRKQYEIKVIKKNEALDLAVLKLISSHSELSELPQGMADDLDIGSPIAVAGFPNHRPGDSGVFKEGKVVGFRMVSAIRRLLIDASIIAGNSGGPVVNYKGEVVGVAVTGADMEEQSEMTENHGVIPIDALNFLPKHTIQTLKGNTTQPLNGEIKKVKIENFKSIQNVMFELGRINVLIGENGAGKSNLLEALALASAAYSDKLDNEFLASRGIRMTKPQLMKSAFLPETTRAIISVDLKAILTATKEPYTFKIKMNVDEKRKWISFKDEQSNPEQIRLSFKNYLDTFIIYSPDYSDLRNFKEEGQIIPLGIHGEGLRELLESFSENEPNKIEELNQLLSIFSWFDSFKVPPKESALIEIHITDKYLGKHIEPFDQRSTSEGFLYALFYFCLFLSPDTPKFFAIDNVDASLNPKLCTYLIKTMAELAPKYDKQVILTTHNPAVLDGINLNDPEQKIFVISRNLKGHTEITSVQKPVSEEGDEPIKLSEAFMWGYIGGLPENF